VLADAALRYVLAGWPILPIRPPVPDSAPSVSVRRLASHRPPSDVDTAADWWGGAHAYGIAAVVGIHFDVLSVPAPLGPPMLEFLRRSPVVAIDHPGGWWLFLTTPGAPAIDDIPRGRGIAIHRAGSYVPLPPSTTATAPVEWAYRVTPLAEMITPGPADQPRLPHSLIVQQAAARAAVIVG
jgi:hypothetical protein